MGSNAWYGWKKDSQDDRDLRLKITKNVIKPLPESYDLIKWMPPVYDQGELGSCSANAVGASLQYNQRKQKVLVFRPSRLFIYYNTRVLEKTVDEDSGATIRNAVKSVVKCGACTETRWPYKIDQFTLKPTPVCYGEGSHHKAVVYRRVARTIPQLQGCIASGFPIIFGFMVYSSFESEEVSKTGIVPMPSKREECMGGHAVLAVGYDKAKKWFICRNSWGNDWGDKGYFYLKEDYFTNPELSDDFWVVEMVS